MFETYELVIEGISPLLQCSAQNMTAAQLDPGVQATKKTKKTPREVAGNLAYEENGVCVHPITGLIASIADAGTWFKDPKNARAKMKSRIPACVFPVGSLMMPILDPVTRKPYPVGAWEVDVRTGVNHNRGSNTRIVVCRPRFDKWMIQTQLEIETEVATAVDLLPVITAAGRRIGLGAFRPQKRGMFGRYRVVCWDLLAEHCKAAE